MGNSICGQKHTHMVFLQSNYSPHILVLAAVLSRSEFEMNSLCVGVEGGRSSEMYWNGDNGKRNQQLSSVRQSLSFEFVIKPRIQTFGNIHKADYDLP